MALDATTGGSASNSYATVADADVYFSDRYSAAEWFALTDSVKASLLVTASLRIDKYFNWIGVKAESTQALAWPRDVDSIYDIDDTDIPSQVLIAVYEYAWYLYQYGDTAIDDTVDSVTVDELKVDFNESSSTKRQLIPAEIVAYIANLGILAAGPGAARSISVYRA